MPYFHVKCGGEIGLWARKCHKCKKVWPLKVLFMYPVPKDMVFQKPQRRSIKLLRWIGNRGTTSYAKWADNAPPGVAEFASHLPNWPRWERILSVVVLILLVVAVILLVRK